MPLVGVSVRSRNRMWSATRVTLWARANPHKKATSGPHPSHIWKRDVSGCAPPP